MYNRNNNKHELILFLKELVQSYIVKIYLNDYNNPYFAECLDNLKSFISLLAITEDFKSNQIQKHLKKVNVRMISCIREDITNKTEQIKEAKKLVISNYVVSSIIVLFAIIFSNKNSLYKEAIIAICFIIVGK